MRKAVKVSIEIKNWVLKTSNKFGYFFSKGNCQICINNINKKYSKMPILNLEYIRSYRNIPIFRVI